MLIYALSHRLVRHPISHTSTTADTAPQPRQRPPEPDTALMALDAAQSSVSSSSTLWAQGTVLPPSPDAFSLFSLTTYASILPASKEWVIPAKPKPGRKPKKELAPPQETQEVCNPTPAAPAAPPPLRQDFSQCSPRLIVKVVVCRIGMDLLSSHQYQDIAAERLTAIYL